MVSPTWRLAATALIAGLLLTGRAQADPLLVLAGGFTYEGDPTGYILSGENFSIGGGGSFQVRSPLDCSLPCGPGTLHDLSAVLGGPLPFGTLAVADATIFGSRFESILLRGEMVFDAPTIVLPVLPASEDIVFTAPFLFSASLSGFDRETEGQLFQADLAGRGVVSLRALVERGEEGRGYFFRQAHYEFTAVPEPATVLLLGAGALALGARFRRCRSRT
jgi:hypothetical protein